MIFTDCGKVSVLIFWEWEIRPFLSQKVNGKMLFAEYWKDLVLSFLGIGNTFFFCCCLFVFFESRSWWNNNIYLLMKSSCFELSGVGKYGLFSAKKLMERGYILGLFKLSMIFRDLGIMDFCAMYAWWNKFKCWNIYWIF